MKYRLLGERRSSCLQEGVDQFLCAEPTPPQRSNAEEDAPLPQESQQKQKRDGIPRICLRMLTFNQTCISKPPISFFPLKRKDPNLQIHFLLEDSKHKLAFPPSHDQTIITVTLAKAEIVIETKNAMQYQMGTEDSKPKWMPKNTLPNAKIVAVYQAKRYTEDALELFLRSNGARFDILDAKPKQVAIYVQPRQQQVKEKDEERTFKYEMDEMERIIHSNRIDWPIQRLLAPLRQPPPIQSCKNAQADKSENDGETQEQPQQSSSRHNEQGPNLLFKLPTSQQLQQTSTMRQRIVQLQAREKQGILTDIFKIKRFKRSDYSIQERHLPCPVHACRLPFPDPQQLRTHLLTAHRELGRYGIRVGAEGRVEYSSKAMDFVLQLGLLYPGQLKKIIKKMKTRM